MSSRLVLVSSCAAVFIGGAAATAAAEGSTEVKRTFDLPHGDASIILQQFAGLIGRQVMFLSDKVRGEQTNAISGEYTPREALDRMLADTNLIALEDEGTGGYVVSRRPRPAAVQEVGANDPSQPQPKPMSSPKSGGKLRALLAHLTLGAATVASAQPAPETAPTQTKDGTIVLSPFTVTTSGNTGYGAQMATSGKLATPYIDIPQASSIVTSEFMQDAKLFDINRAVLYVPGVVSQGDFLGGYVIRGRLSFTGSYTDGTLSMGLAVGGLHFIPTLDTYLFDRIEVVKGPSSVAYGRGDPAGFVNNVTKKPEFRDATEVGFTFGSGNSEQNTYRATLDRQGFLSADHQTAYRFVNVFADGADSAQLSGYRRAATELSVAHILSDGRGRLDVIASYQTGSIPGHLLPAAASYGSGTWAAQQYFTKLAEGTDLPNLPPGINNDDTFGSASARIPQTIFRLTGILDFKLNDHWRTRLSGSYLNSNINGDADIAGPTVETPGGPLGSYLYETSWLSICKAYSAQGDLIGQYDLDRIGAKLVVLGGADINSGRVEEGNFGAFRLTPSGEQFVFVPLTEWNTQTKFGAYDADQRSLADLGTGTNSSAYAQVQLKFFQDRLQVTAAERKIWQDADIFHRNDGTHTPLKTQSPLLPTYTLLFKPKPWLSLYAAHSEHIDPIVSTDLYFGLRSATTFQDVPADDPKRSELISYQPSTKQNEFGVKAQLFGDKLTLSLAHYHQTIEGTLAGVLEPYTTPDGRSINLTRQEQTTAKSEGWEFEAFGQISRRLTYMLSAAFGTKATATGVFQNNLIESDVNGQFDSYSGYLKYSFGRNAFDGLSVTAGGKFIPSGWRVRPEVVPNNPALDYPYNEFFADLGLTYGFLGRYQVFVQGNNLTHKYSAADGSFAAVVPGRQIFAGFTARF